MKKVYVIILMNKTVRSRIANCTKHFEGSEYHRCDSLEEAEKYIKYAKIAPGNYLKIECHYIPKD